MSVPKYFEMHKPFLEALKDGEKHSLKDIRPYIIQKLSISDEDLREMLPSGTQTTFNNRSAWASVYLKKAGLIESPSRAVFCITKEGLATLEENPAVIDNHYLLKYDSFRAFQNKHNTEITVQNNIDDQESTPDDLFEQSFKAINQKLSDDILNEVVKLSPKAFEKMVIDLFSKMYGTFENSGYTTSYVGDEGIDGVIMEDKLGFSLIYIQAKKWDLDSTVGRPAVQGFVGAITGKGGKGLFVTTAKFSKQAIDYAKQRHVILVDGEKLAELMIENNFGVTVKKVFEIKSIDTDSFNDYQEIV